MNNNAPKGSKRPFPWIPLLFALLALITIIPASNIGSNNANNVAAGGYKALCGFAPYSTLILLVLAVGIYIITRTKNKHK